MPQQPPTPSELKPDWANKAADSLWDDLQKSPGSDDERVEIIAAAFRVIHPTPAPADARRLREALDKINGIRNSIIGLQTINWSEHIYPLVAALNEAGLEGMHYPAARKNFGTMLDRTNAAEEETATLREQVGRLEGRCEALEKVFEAFELLRKPD